METQNNILYLFTPYILQGWSAFSIGASRLTGRMTEAGKKLSEVATQKVSEMSGTVSEKVCSVLITNYNILICMFYFLFDFACFPSMTFQVLFISYFSFLIFCFYTKR